MIRIVLRIALAAVLALGALVAAGLWSELRTPEVVRYRVALPHWPAGRRDVTLAFLSDTHVAGPDMPPERLARIVAATNRLDADCVLLGGDYISDKPVATRRYTMAAAIAPLAHLRARGGVIAVTGNHDLGPGHSYRDADHALAAAGIPVLTGGMARCGPVAVFGVDNPVYAQWQLHGAGVAAGKWRGPMLLLVHDPALFFHPDARAFPFVIAGHTHCGQIALPVVGAIETGGTVPRRYACGMHRIGNRTLIVGAGLGTSGVPLRLFTRPQIVLVTLSAAAGPPPAPAAPPDRTPAG